MRVDRIERERGEITARVRLVWRKGGKTYCGDVMWNRDGVQRGCHHKAL